MNWRKYGFSQRKPKYPGVYFVSTDGHQTLAGPKREMERWDVADVIFFAGGYTNVHDNREANAHWRLQTLGGSEYAWRKGMWMKGPISPVEDELRQRPG
jgi:hypothetical protein